MKWLDNLLQKILGKKLEKAIVGNWKTTVAALLAALVLILMEVGKLFDNNPETVINFENVYQMGILVIVGLFAKDGDKTSEDLHLGDK